MDEKYLKTSWQQRLVIIVIAVLLLAITIITYASIVVSGNKSSSSTSETDAALAEYEEQLNAKAEEIDTLATSLSAQYFDEFRNYISEVRSFNAQTANDEGLKITDLKEGDGTEITEEWKDYFAYYIGWCADESVFDSSFDSFEEPTSLKTPLSGSIGLIEGWEQGVVGMKVGGVRQLSIPGELAYGDTQEICGGTNSPLKFVLMAIDPGEEYRKLNDEYNEILAAYQAAYYGTLVTE